MLSKEIKRTIIGGVVSAIVLVTIGSWWHYRCDSILHRNNRLMFKSFYVENEEGLAALRELESPKVAASLSDGQRDLLHLRKASILVKDYDLPGALSELKSVLENSKVAELQTLALVRSIRLLIELRRIPEGLELLKKYSDWLPTLVAFELKGDLCYASGDLKEARSYYLNAWQCNPVEETYRRLLLKIMDC